MSSFIEGILILLVLFLAITVTIYHCLQCIALDEIVHTEPVTYLQAGIVAALGIVVWGIVNIFSGWIPIIDWIVPPLVWVAILKWYTASDWVVATVVGMLAWSGCVFVHRGMGIITF